MLKCTKFDFGWGSAPDPAWGAYSAPPDQLAGFKGPTSKGREGNGRDGQGGERRREKKREGEGKGRNKPPLSKSWIRRWAVMPCGWGLKTGMLREWVTL